MKRPEFTFRFFHEKECRHKIFVLDGLEKDKKEEFCFCCPDAYYVTNVIICQGHNMTFILFTKIKGFAFPLLDNAGFPQNYTRIYQFLYKKTAANAAVLL